ncbi:MULTISPECIES: phospholipase effector Tle1 domain-containing protein [unclassified Psychrobacter]|uniref:phospholipase effector Tle1 domain-containing protein n=3 Tax=Psychrobacter TaxID=497 RepID=UPI003F9B220D
MSKQPTDSQANNKSPSVPMGNGVANPTPKSEVPIEIKTLEVSIFFDGTWNNRDNSLLYNGTDRFNDLENSPQSKNKGDASAYGGLPRGLEEMNKYRYNPDLLVSDSVSYSRLPTGVDRMEGAYKENSPTNRKIYVDGAGTIQNSDIPGKRDIYYADNPIGAGLGWGSTGANAKIGKAFYQLNQIIEETNVAGDYRILLINLFGFSRGSASARIFANMLLNSEPLSEEIPESSRKIIFPEGKRMSVQLKFMGIFDTVSSLGFNHADDEGLDFGNYIEEAPSDELIGSVDPKEMNINLKRNQASRIVHLVASNEYRDKFECYDIRGAVKRGHGVEIHLPGCHTDLGDGLGTMGKIAFEDKGGKIVPEYKEGETTKIWYVSDRDNDDVVIAQKEVSLRNPDKPMDKEDRQDLIDDIKPYSSYDDKQPNVFKTKSNALDQMQLADFNQVAQHLMDTGFFKAPIAGAKKNEIEVIETNKRIWRWKIFPSSKQHQWIKINREQISMLYPIIPTHIMVELAKRYGIDNFNDVKIHEYSIEYGTTYDDTSTEKFGAIAKDLTEQALAWDEALTKKFQPAHETAKGLVCFGATSLPLDELIPLIQPKDEQIKKIMYNKYIHWSSNIATEGIVAPFTLVSLGQINYSTNKFERTFYHG